MKKVSIILAGLLACTCMTTAWAQDDPGFSADQVAENQGAVAYWYAVGYSYVNGQAGSWADIEAIGAPLRGFFSPHSGDAIDFDSELDGEGDMMYVAGDWGPEIHIRLSTGDIVLPGALITSSACGFDVCCQPKTCTTCCDITIYDVECWVVCDNQMAVCKILEWMMWKSFETFECRYGRRPCGEEEWMASGFAPIDMNWREKAPYMDIEYVWKAGKACGGCACILKKAYVTCYAPAPVCLTSCGKPSCNTCAKPKCGKPCCKQTTCSKCNTCAKPKCGGCDKPSCNTCAKTTCKSKCGKPSCNKCAKPKCGGCDKPSCNTCAKTTCKSKCGKPSCDKCAKPKCGGCDKPSCNTCAKTTCKSKCDKPKCNSCEKPKCGSKCDKPKCAKPCCKQTTCSKCSKCSTPKCGKCG